jgi:alpha-1,3-mannosyltransferase
MRILQVARQFFPKVGGIESCVLNLSRGLVARGHTVEVVTLNRDLRTRRLLSGPPEIDSIRIYRIPYIGSSRYPVAPAWLRFIEGFDVIHIHGIDFFVDSAAASRFVGFHRKPIVVTTHGGIFHTKAWPRLKDFYWRNVLIRSLRAVEAVVAVSDRDATLFGSIVPRQKLLTIPNGIDPVFRDARAARVRGRIVTAGRITPSKAIDKVIDLVAALAPEFDDLELFVAGPDETGAAEMLRHHAERLGIASRVKIIGEVRARDLAQLVASAQIFVSAAAYEGFGITTVEALSAGIPVLVTPTGVHSEIVRPGVNGWLWSGLPDADALARLREGLLLPDARLDEMRAAARATAASFDWNVATAKYERVFESLRSNNSG